MNISNFSNLSNYLPILNAVIITDLIVIILLLVGIIDSKVLQDWYHDFGINAFIADILIIFIGIIIGRFLYPYIFSEYNLLYFIILCVVIQIVHDILFYLLFQNIPYGTNRMIDTFKDYGKEVGYKAILADSCMMISAILFGTLFANNSVNFNIILLVVLMYIMPYLVAGKK
jgi:hypothetical protein